MSSRYGHRDRTARDVLQGAKSTAVISDMLREIHVAAENAADPAESYNAYEVVSDWILENYGKPRRSVPASTQLDFYPRMDGWITLFAQLLHGSDRALAEEFAENIGSEAW